ncbi:MAG TPA: DUF924 family protein [Candidatus Binataceae bacterium]|jgi:uncharacterized protein (DUF924 family)
METRVNEILLFWFGDGSDPQHERRWFVQDRAFDETCRSGFLSDHERAAAGELDGWRASAEGTLALILLLDQFPRNLFRGAPRSFATDPRALATAREAIGRGLDLALQPIRRSFVYMPFEHSENLADQEESVRLFQKLAAEHPGMAGYVTYAEQHREVIRRFGRFPYRNAVLGRTSTPAEMEYLRRPT